MAALVERVTPLDLPDSHERPDGPARDRQPAGGSGETREGNQAPEETVTTGAGTDQEETVGGGQGGAGRGVPANTAPPAGDTQGRASGPRNDGGGTQPPTERGNEGRAPAAPARRHAPALPSPAPPAAEDNPGTTYRR